MKLSFSLLLLHPNCSSTFLSFGSLTVINLAPTPTLKRRLFFFLFDNDVDGGRGNVRPFPNDY